MVVYLNGTTPQELVNSYEEELGLKGKEFDGTKSKYPEGLLY